MHAERLLNKSGQALVALAAALVLTACKTEKDPEQPTVLGTPAPVAYLGVEYYYNFGVYGGDGILEYSLTNAPSWLALEDTSNKARQGIIMRGVPGLTGGNRGEQDLGKTVDVTLLTTDGQRVGLQPFDIDVRHNTVSLEAEGFEEGQYPDQESSDSESVCDLPDLGEADAGEDRRTGLHSFTSEVYNEDGSVITPPPPSAQRSKETTPVLVKVLLAKPSVTRIKIAFDLESDFDPSNCEGGFTEPHQRCTHSPVNRGRAMIGKDVVGLGSGSAGRLAVPEYLQYLPDDEGNLTRGVLTLEPGITECFIRLEVVSDDVPEISELFTINLTDVREGLAALGSGDDGVSRTLTIRDNQTSVVFQTEAGYQRDVINAEASRVYRARLENRLDAEASYRVRLGQEEVSSAVPGDDYIIEVPDSEQADGWAQVEELVFGPGENELDFRVTALNDSQVPVDDDKLMVINADERFQDGREFYAAAQDTGLRLTINELVSSLEVGSAGDFAPTDLALARNGQIALVGVDVTGFSGEPPGTPLLVVYDRKGAMVDAVPLADTTVAAEAPPLVSYNERPAEVGNATVTREELAVAFGTRTAIPGAANQGGVDSVKVLLRYDSAAPGYVPVWRFQTGTPGDDQPRGIAMDRSGNLFVGGETTGAWQVQPAQGSETQTNQGGLDSYIQRVGTELSGDTEVPALAWTRQQGSGLDDRVHGVSVQGSSATLIGTSQGSVAGEPQLGGVDLFFYTAASAGGEITVRQLGTTADDRVQDAIVQGSDLWMTAAPNLYTRSEQTDEDGLVTATLTSTSLNSQAASVLGFSTIGKSQAALTLNDLADAATDQFDFLVPFNGDLVTAGYTTGRFSEQSNASLGGASPILARLKRVEPEPEPEPEQPTDGDSSDGNGESIEVEEDEDTVSAPVVTPALETRWRVQREVDAWTDGLVQYRGDKLISLIREGSGAEETWRLELFSGEGRHLNP